MLQHYNIHVYGRVQGVGFRYSARNMASRLDIKGFVKNLPDGSVYLEIEADPESCSSFIEWCRKGPDFGRVDHIDVTDSNPVFFGEFSIRR